MQEEEEKEKGEEEVKKQKEVDFDFFWSKYPNNQKKKSAKDKFLKLSRKDINKILDTIDSFVKYKPFSTYNHPHAITYLNQERWNDELEYKPYTNPALKPDPVVEEANRQIKMVEESELRKQQGL